MTASLGKLLDEQFPGGGERMKTRPLDIRGSIARARTGEDCANIPWMLPDNIKQTNRLVKNRLDSTFDRDDQKQRKEYSQRLIQSASSKQASDEMASYRVFELTNDVMATPFALGFFQQVNLGDDELPAIERPRSRNYQRFTVRSQSIDGGAREAQWRTTKDVSFFEIDAISTDRVEYPLMDIQLGDINQSDAINVELKYDMEMKLDGLALTNANAAQTASGLRALLNIHPNVDPNNIPDGNYLDLNTLFPGTPGVLTLQKMKAILNAVALLQGAGGPLEGLTIQTIHCSPLNMRDSWDFMDLVSVTGATVTVNTNQTVIPAVREQIYSGGQFTSAWGYNWTWSPNQQITKGRMVVQMNKPLGWMFTKTQMDKVMQWNETNSPDHAESNMGEIMYRRVLTFISPDLWKYRALFIDL